MAKEILENEPKDIVTLTAQRIRGTCPEELKLLKNRLKASEVITVLPEKVAYENLPVPRVFIPLEMRAKFLAAKGSEKAKYRREIVRLEKAQKREIDRVGIIHRCVSAIQKSIYEHAAVICTAGEEGITVVMAKRGLTV